jgi:glycerate dehydrogenase
MKIVVLDGYTANPGDLSWAPLEALGQCNIYDRTKPEDVILRAKDADIIITNKAVLSAEIIEKLPNLKYIGVIATGYNVVDLDAAARRKIPVTNVPDYCTKAVAQLTFAHILNLTMRVADHATGVRCSKWVNSIDFCYSDYPVTELANLTLGIIGFGRIGRTVAKIASAFDMNVLVNTRTKPADAPQYITVVDIETLFRASDIVTLHCPLTDENHHFVNARLLSLMKPASILLNVARGPLVDQKALADALNSGRIAAAGIDVLETEPPKPDNLLLTARNCFITPHIGWVAKAARQRLLDITIDNINAFLAGRPQNVVNNI